MPVKPIQQFNERWLARVRCHTGQSTIAIVGGDERDQVAILTRKHYWDSSTAEMVFWIVSNVSLPRL
jgi:hypothetical protein